MPEPRHLRSAPIIEAIIDLQVKAKGGFRPEEFLSLKTRISNRFPKMQERRGVQATFGVVQGQGPKPSVQDLGLQGYFFTSADEKIIAQFRADGFTFNRLYPYTSWDELFPQAMELWRLYSDISRPDGVTRLAVRYINRIVLPTGEIDFATYLTAGPSIPPGLPELVSSFLTRVSIHDIEKDVHANIAQALEGAGPGQPAAVILDIDSYRQKEMSVGDPAIELTFNKLREFKNLIFFKSLTDTTLRGFD